jgi:signal transduction histidine kinase
MKLAKKIRFLVIGLSLTPLVVGGTIFLVVSGITAEARIVGEEYQQNQDQYPDREQPHAPRIRILPRPLVPGIVLLAMLVGGSIVATRIVRDFQKRLQVISETTRRIANGDLDTPLTVSWNDEAGELAHDLNRMRNAIRESRAQQSRLLMGVTHDLGSPLTTILGYLEALEDGMITDENEMKQTFRTIRRKAETLQTRIEDLLELTRLQDIPVDLHMRPFALGSYLDELCASFRDEAELSGRVFSWKNELSSRDMIDADPDHLDRVFENLFHNALRYTRPDDEILLNSRIEATPGAREVVIHLDDSGPGLGDLEPDEAFSLFSRGSKSRNEPGFGLGLAIVRSILTVQGMTITAGTSPLGGARFTVRAVVSDR